MNISVSNEINVIIIKIRINLTKQLNHHNYYDEYGGGKVIGAAVTIMMSSTGPLLL